MSDWNGGAEPPGRDALTRGGGARPPPDDLARLRLFHWTAIVCSIVAVACVAAWRITGWSLLPGAAALALLTALMLLRRP